MHLNIAVSRALTNRRDGKLKTNCLGNEICYHVTPGHSIQHSLEKHGVKNCNDGFFAIYVDFPDNKIAEVAAEISKHTYKQCLDLNQHLEFQDVQQLISVFELKEKEMQLPGNSLLTSIYTKLALKNL